MPLSISNVRELLRRADAGRWCVQTIDGSGEPCKWLPVVKYSARFNPTQHAIGLIDSGEWTCQYADGLRVARPKNLVGFMPVLEFDRPTVLSMIDQGLASQGVPSKVLRTFPFDDLLVLALESSSHWRQHAEAWVDSGYPPNDRIAALLPRNSRVREWAESRIDAILRGT
ncbi:hypothetical protein [Sorangium sp. So ce128]|uniref:hypothetical protein n=1 Tax=Sorangium sp. So ce128 TaxID=3133281 RepID=UPI003F6472E6